MAEETEVLDFRPRVVNLLLYQGDAWSMRVTVKNTDLTGATLTARIKKTKKDTEYTEIQVSPVDLTTGVVDVGQDASGADGFWDFRIVPSGGGLPRTYMTGRVRVEGDV